MDLPTNCVWNATCKLAITKYFRWGETMRLCMTNKFNMDRIKKDI